MSNVIYPNELEFKQLLQQEEVIFIDFFASWCGPCKMLAPSIEKLADEHKEVKVIKIDVDIYPQLAAQYNVQSIPSLLVIKQGNITNKQLGFVPYPNLVKMLKD